MLVLKVLAGDGSGSYEQIIEAIHYAVNWRGPNQEKVRIISMSLGGRKMFQNYMKQFKMR